MNLSLNGEWRLAFDPDDRGARERWHEKEPSQWRADATSQWRADAVDATVPGVWDAWAPDYAGAAWYFRAFDLAAEWDGLHVTLGFDAVQYSAEVWLNGSSLGSHEGGYTPFLLDATGAARQGSNFLCVRVVGQEKSFAGEFSSAGIWGDVSLVGRARAHITDVFIEPDIRRKRIGATITTSAPGQVRVSIEDTPYTITGEPGLIRLDFPEHALWCAETPVLYTLRCELMTDGRVEDTVRVRFGMREFGVKENHFYLNNHPLFIKGVLHHAVYPGNTRQPSDWSVARNELEMAKRAGFNLVRFPQRPPARQLLDFADELGLLVYEEPAIAAITPGPNMAEKYQSALRETILRDRNHPSVVIWGIFDEARGIKSDGKIKGELCQMARGIDPSRIIIDDSGGANVTREPSRMMRPYRNDLEPYDDFHAYQRAPVDRDIELYYEHNGTPDWLCLLSEFGFGGMENIGQALAHIREGKDTRKEAKFLAEALEEAKRGFDERALDRVFGDMAGLAAETQKVQMDAIRFQVDACRANAKLSGYCYSQLCDGDGCICDGILDRERKPKPAAKMLADVQKPIRPIIHIAQANLTPREEAPVLVTLANALRLEGRADLSLQVVGPTNQVLWKKKRTIKIPRHGKELWTGTVGASGSQGTHKFVVRLLQNMTCIAENSIELHVLDPAESCNVEINMLDPQRAWTERCIRFAKAGSVFALIHIVPPLANTVRAYPDNELAQILAQVKGGAVAIVFGPPHDWNELAERIDPALMATSRDAVGAPGCVYHYAKLHPVFDGLPARGLMRQPYRNVVAPKTFIESSDEDICGSFNPGNMALGQGDKDGCVWGSDILVRRYGSGRIVFTHMRILDNLTKDPIADRLFVNLLKHFSRRSVPAETILPLEQKAVEWLRREKTDRTRRWLVIGAFPNWSGKGNDAAYPPEQEIKPEAIYPGWYKAIQWENWHSQADDLHIVDLQAALEPIYAKYPTYDYGTGYAYAEFTCDKRQPATVHLSTQNPTKVWINGRIVVETDAYSSQDHMARESASTMFRHGRNTILVKVSKNPGPFSFSVDFEAAAREPMQIKWWK